MAGREALRRALVAMVLQIEELQNNREKQLALQEQASTATRESEQEQQDPQQQAQEKIDPAQMKQMLLSHVRACKNKQCPTCHKLRERIKSRAACQRLARLCDDELAQGQHDQQPPSTGQPHGMGGDPWAA